MSSTGPLSTTLPGIHDHHLVGDFCDDAEIVRDQDHRHAAFRLKLANERDDLRLNGHIERCRRFVRNEKLRLVGQGHGDHHALAHAARHLVRIGAHAFFGCRDAHAPQHFQRTLRQPAPWRSAGAAEIPSVI